MQGVDRERVGMKADLGMVEELEGEREKEGVEKGEVKMIGKPQTPH